MSAVAAHSFDFIVTGAGAAGRSFVYQLLQSPLRASKILLIDQERKTSDDRTWCFWENGTGPFEEIVHYRWPKLWFHTYDFTRQLEIAPFEYKMIRAADYYRFTNEYFQKHQNVTTLIAEVEAVENLPDGAGVRVQTGTEQYTAKWCINSIWKGNIDKEKVQYLDQHFKGWFVRTKEPLFSDADATLMDFRVPQEGDFRFMYVFPDSPHTALFELAIFSNEHLSSEGYDAIIAKYLEEYWPHIKDYDLVREESGVIPMTDYEFSTRNDRIVHVGTAGGDTRASTGYTFIYIHRRIERLINALVNGDQRLGDLNWFGQRHRYYDSLMLKVLAEDRYPGDQLFGRLFRNNPPARLLRFLNGESSLPEELALMSTTPIPTFLKALVGA
ncbi:MAG: lycopene cyclase family protein [Bacteroidota bacterium]